MLNAGRAHIPTCPETLPFEPCRGQNAIRLTFNHASVLDPSASSGPNEYVRTIIALAQAAAEHGILLLLACQRLRPKSWPGNGLWFDEVVTEDKVRASWALLAQHLCSSWNVFGVDLQNEPYKASWGKDAATDWSLAAARLGNHVLSRCPRWMVFVEGVGAWPGAAGATQEQARTAGIWWGENLRGARQSPVRLARPDKLVYSPHTWGPSVFLQPRFRARGACRGDGTGRRRDGAVGRGG